MTSLALPSVGFDPADPAFRVNPHPAYRALRERGPVSRLGNERYWIATGYDEVRSLLRDPRTFARRREHRVRPAPGEHPFIRARAEAKLLVSLFMRHRSEDDHARLRRLVQPAFSPGRVAERRAAIQRLTDEAIDAGQQRGRLDVVGELSRPLTEAVIADLMGIPEAIRPRVAAWARELVYHIEVFPSRVEEERTLLAMVGLAQALRELISGWRADPPAQDNLLWSLERARADGVLSENEVIAQSALLLLAGHVTTQHLIGNGVLALIRNPDQWELLRARPDLIETAVEELVRYDPPGPVMRRNVLEDIEIGGETIREGDLLLVALAGGNRDPAVFADPERLDITRSPNPHLGFGHGPHFCVGAALARLEAQVAIGTLVHRVPPPRLETEELEWESTLVVRGLGSLPIAFS